MTEVIAAGEVAWQEILEDLKNNNKVVILQDGRAVARVVPIPVPKVRMTLEELRQSVIFIGDVETPIDWNDSP